MRKDCPLGGQFCWHAVLPDPAPPPCRAPRRDPIPVVCPGFGLGRYKTNHIFMSKTAWPKFRRNKRLKFRRVCSVRQEILLLLRILLTGHAMTSWEAFRILTNWDIAKYFKWSCNKCSLGRSGALKHWFEDRNQCWRETRRKRTIRKEPTRIFLFRIVLGSTILRNIRFNLFNATEQWSVVSFIWVLLVGHNNGNLFYISGNALRYRVWKHKCAQSDCLASRNE